MAYEFWPKPGQQMLSIDEVVRRLKSNFGHVELDTDRATQDILRTIEFVQGLRARGATAYTDEDIERQRRAAGKSVHIVVSDDPSAKFAYLTFTLGPEDERIFIGYESDEHEKASEELRLRLARILDYDVELV